MPVTRQQACTQETKDCLNTVSREPDAEIALTFIMPHTHSNHCQDHISVTQLVSHVTQVCEGRGDVHVCLGEGRPGVPQFSPTGDE